MELDAKPAVLMAPGVKRAVRYERTPAVEFECSRGRDC